ncbi:hypothetical protein ABH945_003762 [Paraburkholderia sp. GAS333]|uniref:hypothetical protein n=1 Tax=Paraburkholderia sp. GAS333 TaxID=3156279 RepID=UPI003D1F2679
MRTGQASCGKTTTSTVVAPASSPNFWAAFFEPSNKPRRLVIEPFKSRSVLPPTATWTAADRKQLRRAGINSLLVIDGKVCFPLGGITSAATSTLAVEAQGQLRKDLKSIAEHVLNSQEFMSVIPSDAKPEESFSLALTSRGTTSICESTNSGGPFADAKHDGTDGPFARLGYVFTAPWIKAALAAKCEPPRE